MTQTQTHAIPTATLDAFLRTHHTTLSASIFKLGLEQKLMDSEFASDDLVGRIARLRGMTHEQFVKLMNVFAAKK